MVRNNNYGIFGEYDKNNMAKTFSISENRRNNELLIK